MNKDDLIKDIKRIGVKPGDTLNIKVSLSSIGGVEGGAKTVIEALLDVIEDGTIVAESFVRSYHVSKLKKPRYENKSYAGAVANAMITYPGSVRSKHPIQRFTAIGSRAEELINHHAGDFAYGPLKTMIITGGKNLCIGTNKTTGVGTTHVAIHDAGIKQIIPKEGIWYDGKVFMRDWVGG